MRSVLGVIDVSSSTSSILAPYGYLRQLNLNGCANTFSRTNGDAASHPLSQLSTDGQPEPEAFGVASSPIETLENVGKVDRAYPGSLIFHGDGARSCPKPYISTPAGMLYGVAKKDQEYLLQPLRIGAHARGTLALDTEPEPAALRERLHHFGCLLPRCPQVHNLQAGFAQIQTHAREAQQSI